MTLMIYTTAKRHVIYAGIDNKNSSTSIQKKDPRKNQHSFRAQSSERTKGLEKHTRIIMRVVAFSLVHLVIIARYYNTYAAHNHRKGMWKSVQRLHHTRVYERCERVKTLTDLFESYEKPCNMLLLYLYLILMQNCLWHQKVSSLLLHG